MSIFMSNVNNVLDIFVAPKSAFERIRARPGGWFPIAIIFVAWIAFWNVYYSAVDYTWLQDYLIQQETYGLDEEEKQNVVAGIEKLKPGALIIISTVSVLAILTMLIVVTSVYLVIVSAIVDDEFRFKHWFAFAAWTNMPSLFALIAMSVNFILAPNFQIGPSELNPLSLNSLIFHVDATSPYHTLLSALDLSILWTWGLMVYGYHCWTGRSFVASSAIVLVPSVVFYAVWLLLILT